MVFFTICSNNYLAQAKVLAESLNKYESDILFLIFLCDKKNTLIDYSAINAEIIPVEDIEPDIISLAKKYNIIELNTCIKPRVIEYLLTEKKFDKVIYLDPDIKLFSSVSFLFDELNEHSIILTPHIYTPIPLDGKKPSENTFLIYGLYNLGFIGLKNNDEVKKFISWWKEHTYKQGFHDTLKGIFVDQLPINLAPLFFKKVKILQDFGLNAAPWNLHERCFNFEKGNYMVNKNEPLKFYHFSSFIADKMELPQQHYDRFQLSKRKDLQSMYETYNDEIKGAGFFFFHQFKSAYTTIREEHLKQVKRQKKSVKNFLKKFFG